MLWWVLAASCGAALPVRADARPIVEALQVRRGAACVQRATLAEQLAAWLGEETIEDDVWVIVTGSATDSRDVSFELRRGTTRLARRRFAPAPAGCAPLEAILALAIAMALRASLREELLSLREGAPADAALGPSLAAFAELGLGLLPGTSAGLVMRAELRSRFSLRFDAFSHTSRGQRLRVGEASVDVNAWLVGARLSGCLLAPPWRALVVRACAGVGAGGLHLAGRGASGRRASWLPWFDVGLGAELSVGLSAHWSIDGGGSVELPLGERSFGLRNLDGTVAATRTLPAVAATVRAGPAYHF